MLSAFQCVRHAHPVIAMSWQVCNLGACSSSLSSLSSPVVFFVVAVVDVVDVVAVARSVDVAPSSSLTNLAVVCSHIENEGLRCGQMISIEQMTKK